MIIGVVVSLVLLLSRSSRPKVSILGADPDVPGAYDDIDRHPESTTIAGRADRAARTPTLFYANALSVRDSIEAQVARQDGAVPCRAVILDIDANDELDITSAQQLLKLATRLHQRGVHLCLAGPHTPVLQMLQKIGVIDAIRADHVFPTIDEAVAWASSH